MKSILLLFACLLLLGNVRAQPRPLRSGKHAFTIQWIAFDNGKSGEVMITHLGQDSYRIMGEQRAKTSGDYVTLKGTIRDAGKELIFEGAIESRVSYINNGKPCLRSGPLVFKTTGQRKYWRLQQMLNCDGTTTDYIDIFF